MFSPNCVVVLANPEITIKSSVVRGKIVSRLQNNIVSHLKSSSVSFQKISFSSGRFFIETSEPKKVIECLEKCFGIYSLFLAQKVCSSGIKNICVSVKDICSKRLNGSFAVRGKSYCKEFSSKDLEIALGSEVINCFPELKVNLKSPDSELFCIAFEDCSYFFFEEVSGPKGMPVGSQGKVVLFASTKKADELALFLLRTGCSLFVVGKLSESVFAFSVASPIKFCDIERVKRLLRFDSIDAVFSDSSSKKELSALSKKLGVKVFVPNLF